MDTQGEIRNKKVLFINMYDTNSEILKDFLNRWGFSVDRLNLADLEKKAAAEDGYNHIVYQFLNFTEYEFTILEKIISVIPLTHLIITAPYAIPRYLERLKNMGVRYFLIRPYSPEEAEAVFINT